MNSILFERQPITPSKVVCIGRNYVDHARELNNEVPTTPVIFIKPNSAITDQLRAGESATYHYEGEIALLIKGGQIAGVGFGLDLTNRELQGELKSKGLPWERAKGFDGAAVFSPFKAFQGAVEKLRLELEINGEQRQQGGYAEMIFKPDMLIEEIGRSFTLEDGDIIMTGTPKGVGEFHRGDHFRARILDGDQVLLAHEWQAQ